MDTCLANGIETILVVLSLFTITFMILNIEFILQINNGDLSGAPLSSSRQLIALLFGLLSLLSVAWECLKVTSMEIKKK
jgi:hypothetical protein